MNGAPAAVGARAGDPQPLNTVFETLHRDLGDQPAVVHDADPIAEALELVDEMAGDEDRRLSL